jgi:hypothetical protein
MKTLSKLCINQDNILKNEELKLLKGGNWNGWCWVYYAQSVYTQYPAEGYLNETTEDIEEACRVLYPPNQNYLCYCQEM